MNRYRSLLKAVAHRPWPVPESPWLMTQSWHDLLFAHWPVDVQTLRAHVPSGFDIDTFDGQAWIGIVPFRMTNVAPRGLPALPWISAFPELNVRTYLRVSGRPGVYFFSLDAANPLAVRIARMLVHLPYFTASMTCDEQDGWIEYRSERTTRSARPARLVARYRPTGPAQAPLAGTLDHFLTERYCLFTTDTVRNAYSLEIHHLPWPLQPADVEIFDNTMAEAAGIPLPATRPLLHFARRQDMVAWGLKRVPTRIRN